MVKRRLENTNKAKKTKEDLKEKEVNIKIYQEAVRDLIDYVVEILIGRKVFNITIINTPDYITDYFVIASVDNAITLQAIANYFVNDFYNEIKSDILRELLKDVKIRFDGGSNSGWIVIDLYYFWIHLFLPDIRERYSLERLWSLRNALKNVDNISTNNEE